MKLKQSDILQLITMFYYVLIYLSDIMNIGNILLVFSMLLFFGYSLWTNRGKVWYRLSTLDLYIFVFMVFTLVSSLWATRRNLTIPKFYAMLFILISVIGLEMDNHDETAQKRLLNCLLYGNYAVVYIVTALFGWSNILRMIAAQERYGNVVINANSLGMCAAYALVINTHVIFNQRRRLAFQDLLMLPALLSIIASGSRKALFIVFAGVVGIFLLKNTTHFTRIFSRFLLAVPLVIVAIILLSKIPAVGRIVSRMEDLLDVFNPSANRYNNSAWLRVAYTRTGIDLFRSHPLLGVGIGNSNYYAMLFYGKNQYFHNNLIELLSCGGIIGFLIYYSIYGWIIGVMIKFRTYKDDMYDICFVLLIITVFIGTGMVQYFYKNTYFMLLFLWIEAKKLKKIEMRKNKI